MMSRKKTFRKIKRTFYYFVVYFMLAALIVNSSTSANMIQPSVNNRLNQDDVVNNSNTNLPKISNESDNQQNNIFIKNDVRPAESGTPYTPITQLSGSSNDFSAIDSLQVNHHETLNLNYSQSQDQISDSYTISAITDYTAQSLNYDITDMTAIPSYYSVRNDTTSGDIEILSYTNPYYYRLAQGFSIPWDYAVFYGAKMFLTYDVGAAFSLGTYQLELLLVPADTNGKPDMTNILASDVNDPYSQSNQYNDIGWQFFDFNDVILSKGDYFIVANLSVIDNTDDGSYRHFAWAYYDIVESDGDTYYMDSANNLWLLKPYDYSLLTFLLPCNSSGSALTFTDPRTIDLKDNGQSITSTTSAISGTGTHQLTANTSVSLTFNNSYTFNQEYTGAQIFGNYRATNSSYWQYQIEWNVNWNTAAVDISPYSNLNRTQLLIAPDDWNANFDAYLNGSSLYTINRSNNGYLILCNDTSDYSTWNITTTSPNYINSVTLYDDTIITDRFLLGYWTSNGTHATGYSGSKVVAEVWVQGGGGIYNETTGYLNYTLFNNTGQIIPLKSNLPSRYIFTDPGAYSLANIANTSAGFYNPYIYIDPSINGSDTSGFWTAAILWQNGTEVGFYSLRIVVQTQTVFTAEWEDEPGSNNWVTTNVARKQYDFVHIKGYYYNISEAFFSGNGLPIPNADVSYTTEWSTSGQFIDSAPNYDADVNVSATEGNYSITLVATGAFLENHSIVFYVKVFYELRITDVQYNSYATNYTNFAIYYLALYDGSAGAYLTNTPDYLSVLVGNSTLNYTLTQNVDYTFNYDAGKSLWKLNVSTQTNNLAVGIYTIYFAVGYNDYRASYTDEYARENFSLSITAPNTTIQKGSADTSIYVYYTATIEFRYIDTNHSTSLVGDHIDIWSNISDISISWVENSGLYTITVTDNNPSATDIWIFLNISKANYQSVESYLLHHLTTLTNQAELNISDAPDNTTVYYETSIIIYYNDTTHNVPITGANLISITSNASEPLTFDNFSEIGGGLYNFTFINSASDLQWLNITLEVGKPGYQTATVVIVLEVLYVSTDTSIVGAQTVQIYYLENATFGLLYIDTESNVNITSTNANLTFGGNITSVSIPTWYWDSEIYYISITNFPQLGVYETIVTIYKPGYAQQQVVFYLIVIERPTHLDDNNIEITIYADQTSQVSVSYFDNINGSSLIANGQIDYAFVNGSMSYFDDISTPVQGTLYRIILDPNEATATGLTFILNFTISKYGYEYQNLTITLTVVIRPTSISAENSEQTTYTTTQATFVVYYAYKDSSELVVGATIEVEEINGTGEIIVISFFGNATGYYIKLEPNVDLSAGKTYLFNVTLHKDGYERQEMILILHVELTPSSASVQVESDWIYANENAQITVFYNNNLTSSPILLAEVSVAVNNSEDLETDPSVGYNALIQGYIITINFKDLEVAGNTYVVTINISRAGYSEHTLVVYIHIYPKINYELTLFIVEGTVQQLKAIHFQVNLTQEQILMILGDMYDILQAQTPIGDVVVVTYYFLFANGSQSEEYRVQFTISGYDNETGVYYGTSSAVEVPWQAKQLAATASYQPSDISVVSATNAQLNIPKIQSAKMSDLILYIIKQYTVYFGMVISAIGLILITIIIYFAWIRPKVVKKKLQKKQYLDKVSKIISSVLSMRKIIVVEGESGLPMFDWDFGGAITVDSSLVSGFLQAVSGMGSEISGTTRNVKKLSYGDFVVSSASTEHVTAYLFTTGEISKDIEEGLTSFADWFERRFKNEVEEWDGDATVFHDNTRQIVDRLSEDLYIWTLHPLSVNPFKEKEIVKLPPKAQKIMKFVKKSNNASISMILEYFDKHPSEEILSIVFDLVNNQFLLRKRFRQIR